MSASVGKVFGDPIGLLLGTDFDRFESPTGIHGQCRERGKRLDILTVIATKPGRGQFRRFIEACKADYEAIRIYEVWNGELPAILERYGFKPFSAVENGERLEGFQWKRSAEQRATEP